MKRRKRIPVAATCIVACVGIFVPHLQPLLVRPSQNLGSAGHKPVRASHLIEPGLGIGALKIGDTRQRALQLFPYKPNVDEEYAIPNCGTQYEWLLDEDANVTITFKRNIVSRISAISSSYRTIYGVGPHSSPGEVKRHYAAGDAFLYLGRLPLALGDGPLVVWLDRKNGIGFAFLRNPHRTPEFSVYKVTVFAAGESVCELDTPLSDSQNWRKIPSYSFGPNG